MLTTVNLLTFLYLSMFALRSVYLMSKGDRSAIHFPILVLCLFCGFPLLADIVFGQLEYERHPGFFWASRDLVTSYIYCGYMVFIPLFWLLLNVLFRKQQDLRMGNFKPRFEQNRFIRKLKPSHRVLLSILLLSPVLIVFLTSNPTEYLVFSSTIRSRTSTTFAEGHALVSLFASLSVLSAAIMIAMAKPHIFRTLPRLQSTILPLLCMFIAIWLHGKRGIAALAGVLVLLGLHYRGALRGKRLVGAVMLALVVVLSYSFFFQFYSDRISRSLYENVRIDYGRDDVIKMTIFSELNPDDLQILEYRGQSLLFYSTFFVPRRLWPDKPYPYAQYFTSGLFLAEPRLWGWGMTTSWLEEAIANFGWAGMFVGPFLIWLICYIGDRKLNVTIRLLTPLIASLLLVVQAMAFMPLILLWGFLVIQERRKKQHLLHPRMVRT